MGTIKSSFYVSSLAHWFPRSSLPSLWDGMGWDGMGWDGIEEVSWSRATAVSGMLP